MKESTFFIILFSVFFLISLIGKLIRKESFLPKETSFFDRIYRSSWLIIPFMIFVVQSRCNYYRDISDDVRVANHIPCIDNNMRLDSRTKSLEIWRSKDFRNDSISHQKDIDIDMTGIYKETDYFVNTPQNQTLIIYNRVPGWFRSHQVKYKLLPTAEYSQRKKVEAMKLDSIQVDSVIKSWNYIIDYDCK